MQRWLDESDDVYDTSPRQRRNDIVALLAAAMLTGLVAALFTLF